MTEKSFGILVDVVVLSGNLVGLSSVGDSRRTAPIKRGKGTNIHSHTDHGFPRTFSVRSFPKILAVAEFPGFKLLKPFCLVVGRIDHRLGRSHVENVKGKHALRVCGMAKPKQDRPQNAFEVKTYEEYREEVGKLFLPTSQAYNALLVVGNNGLGKSRTCEELYGKKQTVVISGKPTGWGLYKIVEANCDKKIFMFDDVSPASFRDLSFNGLLKNLLETRATKTLRWPSDACKQAGIPNEFTTQAKSVILCNQWDSNSSENYGAIDWRCVSILFNPSPIALHHQVASYFYDEEVFTFIWENINMITKPNMRMYGLISQLRRAGMRTWKTKAVEIMAGNKTMAKVYEILTDAKLKTTAQKIDAFERSGLGKKSLFYELKAEFKWLHEVPSGPAPALKYDAPPPDEDEVEEIDDEGE